MRNISCGESCIRSQTKVVVQRAKSDELFNFLPPLYSQYHHHQPSYVTFYLPDKNNEGRGSEGILRVGPRAAARVRLQP